jgi:hypothetical protein
MDKNAHTHILQNKRSQNNDSTRHTPNENHNTFKHPQ